MKNQMKRRYQDNSISQFNKQNKDLNRMYNFSKNKNQPKPSIQRQEQQKSYECGDSDFVQCVNGYIKAVAHQDHQHHRERINKNSSFLRKKNEEIKKNYRKESSRQQPSKRKLKSIDKITSLSKHIDKQKIINKNLQKCIIQIQKVLWERSQNLQNLQNQLKFHKKEIKKRYTQGSQQITSNEPSSNLCSQDYEQQSQSSSNLQEQSFHRVRERRKTEIPHELQRILTKTVAVKSKGKNFK